MKKSYVCITSGTTPGAISSDPFAVVCSGLNLQGYKWLGEVLDLEEGTFDHYFYKAVLATSDVTEALEWEQNSVGFQFEKFDVYGFFLKLEDEIKGGLWGIIHDNDKVAIPHAWITHFWVHKDLRGKGYGTQLMQMVLYYLKEEEGIHVVELATTSYLAPNLYRRMGFVEFQDYPASAKTLDGHLHDSYDFRKVLCPSELQPVIEAIIPDEKHRTPAVCGYLISLFKGLGSDRNYSEIINAFQDTQGEIQNTILTKVPLILPLLKDIKDEEERAKLIIEELKKLSD